MMKADPAGKNNCGVEPSLWLQMSKAEKHRCYVKASKARLGDKRTKEQIAKQNRGYRERYPKKCRELKKSWIARNPEKEAARKKAYWEKNRERLLKVRALWRAAKAGNTPLSSAELRKKSLRQNDFYAAAERAVPAGYPRWIRDDVISDIVLAVLEGEITIEQIATRARKYITRHYAEFADRKTLSLDAPIPGLDGVTYLDRLAMESAE